MFYEHIPNSYSFKFPAGAIRSKAELQDIFDAATLEDETIALYWVGQSGYIRDVTVLPGAKITFHKWNAGGGAWCFVGRTKNEYLRQGYHEEKLFLGDMGVSESGENPDHENHRLFTNRMHAESYANWMKTDPEYQAGVKAWHKYCDDMFYDFDDWYDE